MPKKRIAIIQGHPDTDRSHFCHALAGAYEQGALAAGHEVRHIDVAQLDFPLIRARHEFEHGALLPGIAAAQETIRWAQHLVILYPLWLGTLPALLKGFFEQTFRYGFALGMGKGRMPQKLLKGRSARVFVTMGMPAAAYRLLFRAHGVKSLDSSVLALSGFRPIHDTLIGSIESLSPKVRERHLREARALGEEAR
jgi:putative NADPH-quinone reductase